MQRNHHLAQSVGDASFGMFLTMLEYKCSWTCTECGMCHDRDFNAVCNIKEFGLKALPTERGKVKPVDCPTMDDRPCVLKSRGRKKQEKRGGFGVSEAAKSLV